MTTKEGIDRGEENTLDRQGKHRKQMTMMESVDRSEEKMLIIRQDTENE